MIVVNLSAAILPRLAWWILRRQQITILNVEALFPPLNRGFTCLAKVLDRTGLAPDAARHYPELQTFREAAAPELTLDIFRKIEPWLNDRYDFATTPPALGEYGYAYKHATCNFIRTRLALPVTIRTICQGTKSETPQFAGFDRDTVALYRAFYDAAEVDGEDQAGEPRFVSVRRMTRPINGLLFIGIALTIICFVLSRLRILPPEPESIALGADFIGDARDRPIYDLSQDGPALLVPRNQSVWRLHAADYSSYRMAPLGSGVFGPSAAMRAAGSTLRDVAKLHRHCRRLTPDHYFAIVVLAYRRCVFRALIARYRFRNFWCRDDYNAEHIIRTQELRRTGGRSMGLNHGYPILAAVVPHYRYIDYDLYFTFGRHLGEKYYSDTWTRDMRVLVTGSFAMTRDRLERAKATKPDNILIFLKIGFWLDARDAMLEALVVETATAFPDREIIVKFKSYARNPEAIEKIVSRWRSASGNIVVTESNVSVYELLDRGRYAISDPSSIAAEAIHFGLTSFVLDFEEWESLMFRDFPAFCVRSAEEAIERIRAIERGDCRYPRESFEPLIALDAPPLGEQVAEAML